MPRLMPMRRVSPEFVLRPLLSVSIRDPVGLSMRHVSPEFVLRPLLSGPGGLPARCAQGGVAGVCAPAFVERKA